MAVNKKGAMPSAKVLKDMKQEFLSQVEDLWTKNIKDALGIIEDAEERKINVAFGTVLDFTEKTPKLKTAIRFTKSFTDERVKDFEDPDQVPLPGITDGKKPKPGRAPDAPEET